VVNFAEELDWFSPATDALEEGLDVKIRQYTADA